VKLTFRQRVTWFAHLFKGLAYQYHRDLAHRFGPLVPEDGVIIDVGAHSGQHSKLFARIVPDGAVYAFEPSSYALSILRKVVAFRRLRNVSIMAQGLSDRPTTNTLNIPIKKRGSIGFGLSHLGENNATQQMIREDVSVTTLDHFATGNGLDRVDLIKVDIEGWEHHFLRGAIATIERFRPVLMLEVSEHALQRAGSTGRAIFETLEPFGYAIFKTFENDAYRMTKVDGYDGSADYVFVPPEKASLLG
jgi:FkbM family methyltransferase